MSRSIKKTPIVKDKRDWDYWKRIRRVQKQIVKLNYFKDDFIVKSHKEITNNYDYRDWWFYMSKKDRFYNKKYLRK